MEKTEKSIKPLDRHILRQKVLAARDRLTTEEKKEKSISLVSRLLSLQQVKNAHTVFTYMNFRSEVQTTELILELLSAGKNVCIPVTKAATSELVAVRITDPITQVTAGYYGIPEPLQELVDNAPCDPETIDVVTVPGSVFDRSGGRLGYGGGFYDRFLVNRAPGAVRIGLAYELQMVESVPVEPHDQLMDYVVTEKNLYDCRRYRNA